MILLVVFLMAVLSLFLTDDSVQESFAANKKWAKGTVRPYSGAPTKKWAVGGSTVWPMHTGSKTLEVGRVVRIRLGGGTGFWGVVVGRQGAPGFAVHDHPKVRSKKDITWAPTGDKIAIKNKPVRAGPGAAASGDMKQAIGTFYDDENTAITRIKASSYPKSWQGRLVYPVAVHDRDWAAHRLKVLDIRLPNGKMFLGHVVDRCDAKRDKGVCLDYPLPWGGKKGDHFLIDIHEKAKDIYGPKLYNDGIIKMQYRVVGSFDA